MDTKKKIVHINTDKNLIYFDFIRVIRVIRG